MKKPGNPFPTAGYYGADYFCDRTAEAHKILQNITNGQSVTLTAIRRIGKTGLIQHVIARLPVNWTGVYVDILGAENLNDFLNLLVTALVNSVPEKSPVGKKFWNFIRSLRPTLTFDALTGTPQVTIEIKPIETTHHIESVLMFLEEQPHQILLAIDEFQQILNFPEKNTDAWLRSVIQRIKNIKFIFSGSQQHLMTGLFTNPSRPFFRSTQFMKLGKINTNEYRIFILRQFEKGKKKISENIVDNMLEWADHHTYYVQLICNRVYSYPDQTINDKIWTAEAFRLLKEQETVFFNYRDLLTQPQWNLLKAIAYDLKAYTPTSGEFMTKHHLSGSATVLQGLRSLEKKEMIFADYDSEGKLYYSVYDVLFQRWIQQILK